MSLIKKTSPLWWTENIRYLIYFTREATGPIIAAYFFAYLIVYPKPLWNWAKIVALAAAILHSVTWFWVTTRLAPIPLNKAARITVFLALLAAAAAFSYLALKTFYE